MERKKIKKKKRANPGGIDVEEYGGKAVGKECKKLRQKTWKRVRKTVMETPPLYLKSLEYW